MKDYLYRLSLIILSALIISPGNAQNLATLKVNAQLSDSQGRSIVNARNHHFIIDSPPPLGGPNEAINPIEILLSSLGSCGVLVSEKVAQELDINLTAASATVEGDLDPRGVKGADVNPRIQAFRIKLNLSGPNKAQAEKLVKAVKTRCPIYTTLERAAPIELEVNLNGKSGAQK